MPPASHAQWRPKPTAKDLGAVGLMCAIRMRAQRTSRIIKTDSVTLAEPLQPIQCRIHLGEKTRAIIFCGILLQREAPEQLSDTIFASGYIRTVPSLQVSFAGQFAKKR